LEEKHVGLHQAISAEEVVETEAEPATERNRHNRWLLLIAAYKGLQALLFVALGIGALHLVGKDLDDIIGRLGDFLRSPESRFVNFLYDRASLVNDPMLRR